MQADVPSQARLKRVKLRQNTKKYTVIWSVGGRVTGARMWDVRRLFLQYSLFFLMVLLGHTQFELRGFQLQ